MANYIKYFNLGFDHLDEPLVDPTELGSVAAVVDADQSHFSRWATAKLLRLLHCGPNSLLQGQGLGSLAGDGERFGQLVGNGYCGKRATR